VYTLSEKLCWSRSGVVLVYVGWDVFDWHDLRYTENVGKVYLQRLFLWRSADEGRPCHHHHGLPTSSSLKLDLLCELTGQMNDIYKSCNILYSCCVVFRVSNHHHNSPETPIFFLNTTFSGLLGLWLAGISATIYCSTF